MSGINTQVGGDAATVAGPFTFGLCQVHSENECDGAAVFDAGGEPFVLISADCCIGGDALKRAQQVARLLNGMGWDGVVLLAEAAARFRGYEEHHRSKASGTEAAATKCVTEEGREEFQRQAMEIFVKADTNGRIAARIEHWLQGGEAILWHPVEAFKHLAHLAGYDVPEAQLAAMRRITDAPVLGGHDEAAAAAVDEALGLRGPGPFAPSFRTVGGSTRPVVHTEEAAIDAARAAYEDVPGLRSCCDTQRGTDHDRRCRSQEAAYHRVNGTFAPGDGPCTYHGQVVEPPPAPGFVRMPLAEGLECADVPDEVQEQRLRRYGPTVLVEPTHDGLFPGDKGYCPDRAWIKPEVRQLDAGSAEAPDAASDPAAQ